jgi:predicted O-methyltransferase YrrM
MWKRADRAEGWYSHPEATLLFAATKGPWIEIGSWEGRSTLVLAQTGYPGWAIDTFRGSSEHERVDTYEAFCANLAGFDNVTVVRSDYRDAFRSVPRRAKLLHIDHEHSYKDTKIAFNLYSQLLDKDGMVAIHDAWTDHSREPADCPWPEVTKFARELLDHPKWTLWDDADRLAVFCRR